MNSVFGTPRDPFRWQPKNDKFPFIMERSREQYVRAFQQWINAKCEWGEDDHPGNTHLEYCRLEVAGLVRMYLDCIIELYLSEQGELMYGVAPGVNKVIGDGNGR